MEALLEWRDKFEGRPMVSRPLASDLDIIRITSPVETLEELAENTSILNTDPGHKKYREAVSELTVSGFHTNNRTGLGTLHYNYPASGAFSISKDMAVGRVKEMGRNS